MAARPGCRMASLALSLTCLLAENLQVSRGRFPAQRTLTKLRKRIPFWYFASWNVRSLVDVDAPPETACVSAKTAIVEERKIDLVVREIDRYNINVAALQGTWWFGSAAYRINRMLINHIGDVKVLHWYFLVQL